jgi:hypothetical protein
MPSVRLIKHEVILCRAMCDRKMALAVLFAIAGFGVLAIAIFS